MGTILYPFDIELNNNQSFTYTVNLANRVHAPVVMFTHISPKIYDYTPLEKSIKIVNKEKKKVYCHILELKGHYMSFQENWKKTLNQDYVLRITEGDLHGELEKTISEENSTIIVIDTKYANKNKINPLYLNSLVKSLKICYVISNIARVKLLNPKNLAVLN